MSFILFPEHGEGIQVNGWNWRPTLELLRAENLISEENYERMGTHGCDVRVDAVLALRMAEVIERRIAVMQPGERILYDLTNTAAPKKTVTFPTPQEIDVVDLYSASYEWLVTFRDFCRASGGFKV